MKIQFPNTFILGVIIVTAVLLQRTYAVNIPEGINSQSVSAADPAQKLKEADSQLRKIVSEMEQEQGTCKDCLRNIKAELVQVESQLSSEKQRHQEKLQKKTWLPARVIWALEQGSK